LKSSTNKGFTLLEVLLVVSLLLVVFGLFGFSFINTVKGNLSLKEKLYKNISHLSVYNQLTKQLFSVYTEKEPSIYLEQDRLSFYTLYPVFFEGGVRAEYYTQQNGDKTLLLYEEFPYIDGRLGYKGTKKMVLGSFKTVKFEAVEGGRVYKSYKGEKPPEGIVITLDNHSYIITTGRE